MPIYTLCLLATGQADKPKPIHQQPLVHQQILSQYLSENGDRFNCYFTIEEPVPFHIYYPYEQKYVLDKPPVASLGKLVEKLRKDLPDALIVPDSSNPKIIHIINKKLPATSGYPLDQLVTLSYQGGLDGLATAIGTQIKGAVELQLGGTTRDMLIGDTTTQVQVNVHELPVREVLTSAIPLTGYNRILWRALPSETPKDGTYAMYLLFYGPEPHLLNSKP